MATATCDLSEEQFKCSICLDVFTDPVTTPCGHNFCKTCLELHWANAAVYKCPYCKQAFTLRPELKVNIFISEMVQQFRSRARSSEQRARAAGPGEVGCDLCPEPRLKALKSCLVCLSSYCEHHLQPHRSVPGLKRHQLMEPLKDLSERVCEEHNKPLELYCVLDQCCICMLCTYCTHKDHEVLPLSQASEQHKQQLEKTVADLQDTIKTREKKIQQLHQSVEMSNIGADREIASVVKVLGALKESVEKCLDKVIQDVTKKRKSAEEQTTGMISEIEQEISELKRRRSEVEELSQSKDHFHILQNISQINSAPRNKDWTQVNVCRPSYSGTVLRAASELEQELIRQNHSLVEQDLWRARLHRKDVKLDRNSAHPQLTVSVSYVGTEVQHSSVKSSVPDRPDRFDKGLYVLGTGGFCETFYFESKVRGKSEWTVGVAKETVNRKGEISLKTANGFWTLSFRNNRYYASTDPQVCVLGKAKSEKVGVFVNYEDGIVSFYNIKDQDLIYSFANCFFKEKLLPFCSPGRFCTENSAPLVMDELETIPLPVDRMFYDCDDFDDDENYKVKLFSKRRSRNT